MISKKNILIVDDEIFIRNFISRFLADKDYACWTANDAAHAKDILKTQSIDLLLCDINLPGESGSNLARYVKQEYPDIAIIIMSIIDSPNAAKEALDLGVFGYIVKPFTHNIVLINIENALRRHRLELQNKIYQQELETKVCQQTNKRHSRVVFLQNLLDTIPSSIFYLNPEGVFLGCNKIFERFVGKPRDAILGKNISMGFPENLVNIFRDPGRQSLSSDQYESEIIVEDAAGELRHMTVSMTICTNKDGHVGGTVGTMLDITERKKMEAALQTFEEQYRQTVENIGIGIAIINPQMEITRMNPQMKRWFPCVTPGIGARCHQSFQNIPKESPCENCPAIKTFAEGKSFETTIRMEGGQKDRYFRDHSSPIHDEKGNIVAAILLVEEVTDKLTLERDLRQTQKLEAIGQLAAGIAHEINTPIQYVADNARFLQDGFKDLLATYSTHEALLKAVRSDTVTAAMLDEVDTSILAADLPYLTEEIPRAIEQSLEGVQRVIEIVCAMRDFSHPGSDQKRLVNLNHAIKNTVTVARNEWKDVAEMALDLDHFLPEVFCLPGEINQVLLNIIVNAAHAIADTLENNKHGKGKITIATCQKNDSIVIHIGDTGTGIPKAIQHRIFDPFFTTKGVGQGTGQGLAIAHRVITEKHGGILRFETEQGYGTTFIIELPLLVAGNK